VYFIIIIFRAGKGRRTSERRLDNKNRGKKKRGDPDETTAGGLLPLLIEEKGPGRSRVD